MTAAQLLTDARRLLADPDRWTKGHYARDPYHNPITPGTPQAHSFCAAGGLYHVTAQHLPATDEPQPEPPELTAALSLLATAAGGPTDLDDTPVQALATRNDAPDTGHADMLGWYNQAIATATVDTQHLPASGDVPPAANDRP